MLILLDPGILAQLYNTFRLIHVLGNLWTMTWHWSIDSPLAGGVGRRHSPPHRHAAIKRGSSSKQLANKVQNFFFFKVHMKVKIVKNLFWYGWSLTPFQDCKSKPNAGKNRESRLHVFFLDLFAHLPFATVHLPFLINTLALFYNFGKSWKSDPGIIKASEEQKKKVNQSLVSCVFFECLCKLAWRLWASSTPPPPFFL